MQFKQLEYREKTNLNSWRRMQLPMQATLVSDEAALPGHLLKLLSSLTDFACGRENHGFEHAISRMVFGHEEDEWMWFAKANQEEDGYIIDEEELYRHDNVMLMRRAEDIYTVGDSPEKPLPILETMFNLRGELDVLPRIQEAFGLVQYVVLTDDTAAAQLEQLQSVPADSVLLIDGSQLSAPAQLGALIQRADVQLLCTGCAGLPEMTITKKGKMISCK